MFAFAVYDHAQEKLLLARDRLGKKPLHYAFGQGRFLFASEIKALLAVEPQLAATDNHGILQYFYFGYIPDPCTAFRDVKKLPPGHLLELQSGRARIRPYWDLPQFATPQEKPEQELLEELELQLGEAVRMRLMSDVPLGALLSGGIDSSTVVALMARFSSKPVKTFSIGFAEDDFNETGHARAVAEKFSTDHHQLVLQPQFSATLDTLTHFLEEPFADASILPTYHVSSLARRYVTVALSGDGGDELFAGYDRYQVHLDRQKLNPLPGAWGDFYRQRLFPRLPSSMPARRLWYNLSLAGTERYLDSIAHSPVRERERSLFSAEFLHWAESQESPFAIYRDILDHAPASDPLSQLQYLDLKTYLPADILTKVDRMSMATSLEVRVPLLDHVLAEWVTALPIRFKMRGKQRKYLLTRLAERLGVPSQVLHRPKKGFAMPLVHWMRNELKAELLDILTEPRTLARGYLNLARLRKVMSEHTSGQRDHSAQLWQLLILELWHRNYLPSVSANQRAAQTVETVPAGPPAWPATRRLASS